MKNLKILSKRYFQNWPSWHLIYEWEDDFSSILDIPVINAETKEHIYENTWVRRFFTLTPTRWVAQFVNSVFASKDKYIAFELTVKKNFSYSNGINSIPIVVDFFTRDAGSFHAAYKNSTLICITSLEAFNFLKDNHCNLNIRHLPLSLSDRYMIDRHTTFTKKYDIILAGRKNKILWDFLLEYEKKFPDIEYLYQEEINGQLFYSSNKSGILGSFHTRQEYTDLLKQCRIGFYSTAGIDGGEIRTGGFNPVTPRYLELIASGCLLLGRYPDTDETRSYELQRYCPNVDSYLEFETLLSSYLSGSGPDLDAYVSFLKKHYTSNVALQLKDYVEAGL
ncbi:hypothetical protein [Pedobacter metabolipauper]|nr:hypothetical protein [Pedobacter metabolipauper]